VMFSMIDTIGACRRSRNAPNVTFWVGRDSPSTTLRNPLGYVSLWAADAGQNRQDYSGCGTGMLFGN
jgi:hypothetical protein